MSVDVNMIKVGPAGGQNGTVWDEKGKGQIAKIFLSCNGNSVCSLQFLFVENGNFVLSNRHGTPHNENFTTVVLDYPSEYLTWIEGSYETYLNTIRSTHLRSIIFGTNKRSHGPYGSSRINPLRSREFKFEIGDDGSFGGFHGTIYKNWIESIGVYVKTVTSSMIRPIDSRVKVKREEED